MSMARRLAVPWKAYVTIVAPLALVPLAISTYRVVRCLYVVGLMGILWATEALHYTVVAFFPVFLYPMLGILATDKVCYELLKDTCLMFTGGLILAAAVESCRLHERMTYWLILRFGTTSKGIMSALMLTSVFLSMWFANSGVAAVMFPVVATISATLRTVGGTHKTLELKTSDEDETLYAMLVSLPLELFDESAAIFIHLLVREGTTVVPVEPPFEGAPERPDNETVGYYIAVAYGSTIGGVCTLLGTPANLLLKLIYEQNTKDYHKISYASWMIMTLPYCVLATALTLLWLQIRFNRLWWKKTPELMRGIETKEAARNVLATKLEELGTISFQEVALLVMLVLLIISCTLRQPVLLDGWITPFYLGYGIFDCSAILLVVLILFALPVNLNFFRASEPYEKETPTILIWKFVQSKTRWDIMLLFGGSFAMAEGMRACKLNITIAELVVEHLGGTPPILLMVLFTVITTGLTSLACNTVVASVALPILAIVAQMEDIHPLYLMMPAALASSIAFNLPASTPPNSMAVNQGGVTGVDLVLAGLLPSVVCLLLLLGIFLTIGVYGFNLDE